MNWLEGISSHPVVFALLILAVVAAVGMAIGSIRVRGIGLGVAGVLFSGIAFGHFGFRIEPEIIEFVRDFGLVLFVYTIGMQVGPGFLTSLRQQGLPLNLMAASIVVLGGVITLLVAWLGGIDIVAAVGLFSGATTNTPSLGAAQEALKSLPGLEAGRLALPALAYAAAYPFGILGIILSMLLIKSVFRVDLARESESFGASRNSDESSVARLNIEVENSNLNGLTLGQIPGVRELGVVVSRVRSHASGEVRAATPDTALQLGDVLLAVGTPASLEKFRVIVGKPAALDLRETPSLLEDRRVVVTHTDMLGPTLDQLALDHRFGVTVTRLTRADIELTAVSTLRLQFGDMLQLVGERAALDEAAHALGNSLKALNHTNFVPVFVGIALGLLLGSFPFRVPGIPTAITLGVAGGPLLVAIILSRIGRIGPVVWYMPVNANIALRELGISLFLACVGLKAGTHFVEILLNGDGLYWMACAALITLLPLLMVGVIGRAFFKLNYLDLCGLLSGSMTDPPALAFANSIGKSDAPAVAYATVYPLTMILRILIVQIIVLFFVR